MSLLTDSRRVAKRVPCPMFGRSDLPVVASTRRRSRTSGLREVRLAVEEGV